MLVGDFMVVNISPGLRLTVSLRPRPQHRGAFNEGPLFDRSRLEPPGPYLCMILGLILDYP